MPMKHLTVKFSPTTKEVQEISPNIKGTTRDRISEENLFSLFTADIIKQKIKFIR